MTRDSSSVAELNRLLSELLTISASARKYLSSKESTVEVSDQVPAGRGLVFRNRIEPEQVLLTLPFDTLINVKTYKSFFHPATLPIPVRTATSGRNNRITNANHSRSSSQLLSFLLARARIEISLKRERTNAETNPKHQALQRFVQTLPQRFDTVPLTWSMFVHRLEHSQIPLPPSWKQRLFGQLLQALPPHSQYLQHKVRQRFEKDWQALCALRDTHPALLAEPALLACNPDLARNIVRSIDLDTFLWAWLCVNSRCLYLPLGLADHADNFTLAPLLDMANHTSDPALECKVTYASDGGFELRAPSNEAHRKPSPKDASFAAMPGDECFITYGPHSNESLLSEYGFVLPTQLTLTEHASQDASSHAESGQHWQGSRYVDVLMDHHVERLLQAQGADGERKIELLQNRGYWRGYTVHPYPEPAHPSHRLIPALRLAALDLNPPTITSLPSKMAKAHTKGSVKAGYKPHFQASSIIGNADESSDLDRWEATLTGFRDTVSDENERQAHRILVDLCQARRKDTETARQHLCAAQTIFVEHSNNAAVKNDGPVEPDLNACTSSMAFVQQLLDEEQKVLELVSRAAHDQVEW